MGLHDSDDFEFPTCGVPRQRRFAHSTAHARRDDTPWRGQLDDTRDLLGQLNRAPGEMIARSSVFHQSNLLRPQSNWIALVSTVRGRSKNGEVPFVATSTSVLRLTWKRGTLGHIHRQHQRPTHRGARGAHLELRPRSGTVQPQGSWRSRKLPVRGDRRKEILSECRRLRLLLAHLPQAVEGKCANRTALHA